MKDLQREIAILKTLVARLLKNGGGGGGDNKVKVSSNDTTANFLSSKIVAGANINVTEINDGGNETLSIEATVTSGADGADGADGLSAYEIAVNNGFIGTEVEWLASLVGADGADGEFDPSNLTVTSGDGIIGIDYLPGEVQLTLINQIESTMYFSPAPLTFNLTRQPVYDKTSVYLNGIRLRQGVNYTVSGQVVTCLHDLYTGDVLTFDYFTHEA